MVYGALCFSTDKLFGRKKAKDRVTVLVCVNMDGSDKRPLLVMGKSNQPRCFRGIPTLHCKFWCVIVVILAHIKCVVVPANNTFQCQYAISWDNYTLYVC